MHSEWDGGARFPIHICVHTSKTRRMIMNPERFLYSKANMNPNPIEVDNRFHAQMEGGYSIMLRD